MDVLFDDVLKTKPYPEGQKPEGETFVSNLANTVAYQSFDNFPDLEIPEKNVQLPKDSRTLPYLSVSSEKKRTSAHQLGIGDKLELNSLKYEITGMISGEGKSGEAIIYKVKSENGAVYALKLYYEFDDEHLEPSADTLQRIRELKGRDILHLFDFGTGPNKYLDKFCFEISDFAEGGDLLFVENLKEKYSPQFLENVVIAGIHRGIKALHSEKIYHCDLKPQNVYFLDKTQTQVVIGDYGSAKSFEKSSEKELSHTTITKGTEFYLAPEQAFGIVSEKNDYYSLGMIVLHLLYPENVTRKNLRRIFERRTKGVQIIDFEEKYQHLNQLIEGLTLQDYNNRWGEEEVTNWLLGRAVSVNYAAYGNRNFIRIGDSILRSSKEVVDFIEAGNPFYEALIEDKEGYSILLTWVSQLQGDENRRLFDKMISYYKKFYGIDYVREAILFYFAPLRTVSIGLVKFDFNNIQKLTENINQFIALLDDRWKMTDFATLRFYFFQFEFAVRQLRVKSPEPVKQIIDEAFLKITRIIGTDYQPDFSEFIAGLFVELRNEHLINIFYAFNQSRSLKDLNRNQYSSLDHICTYFESNPRSYDDAFMLLERKGYLQQCSKEQLVTFVTRSDTCLQFLFRGKDDIELLASVLNGHLKSRHSLDFLYELLRFYQSAGFDILRVVLLRLLDFEKPVEVGDEQIFLYQKGNFNNKVRDFFTALDDLWKEASFDEVLMKFFEFEFVMLQIGLHDRIAYKSTVSPVFDKISRALRTATGDFATLRANYYKQFTDENIIDLLYQFIPGRTFRPETLKSLNTVEEVALYFVANPEYYNQKICSIELNAFLTYHNLNAYNGLSLQDFILKVFKSHTTIETRVKNIVFDVPVVGEATVDYDYTILAGDYFESKGMKKSEALSASKPDNVVIKKGQFANDDSLYERFVSQVLSKHHLACKTLAGQSAESFKQVLANKKQLEYFNSYTFIPKYLLYLFPVFGMVFFTANYLLDYSVFKEIMYNISPSLNLVSVRMARSYYSIVLFAGYSLNLLMGILLLLPILSFRKEKSMFNSFFDYHGSLLNSLMLFFIFGPLIFIGVYFLIDQFFSEIFVFGKKAGIVLSSEKSAIFLYMFLLTRLLIKIVIAFFQTYKKFRLLPLFISIFIYLVIGYFTIIMQNQPKAGVNARNQGMLNIGNLYQRKPELAVAFKIQPKIID